MIVIADSEKINYQVEFIQQDQQTDRRGNPLMSHISGAYQAVSPMTWSDGRTTYFCGTGAQKPEVRQVRECAAAAARVLRQAGIQKYQMDVSELYKIHGPAVFYALAEGVYTGSYEKAMQGKERAGLPCVYMTGIAGEDIFRARKVLEKAIHLAEAQNWCRDLVNMPGNLLRPMDFARAVMAQMEEAFIECELLVYSRLNAIGLHALTKVGGSSENPPCLLVLRYQGGKKDDSVTGLIGKGVTCDTGGYCLKPAASMAGIKGDMAGGAAVAGAVYALAVNQVPVNVTGVIPMCENRISSSSLVPGDVISSYSGKTIEICNTDAEGRLVLADAVSYAIRTEKAGRIVDIATLTGAVVNMFGFSTAGALSNDETFYQELESAAVRSGERYWRLPVFEEQEKMLKSEFADIKNIGKDYCGTITAGVFIRAFAEEKPWIHLDIAGTAWVDTPLFEGQTSGATGAGLTTLYHMFDKGE